MKEIWKDIEGFEGKYKISNLGRVESLNYLGGNIAKILKPKKNKQYYCVHLCKNGKVYDRKVHRLVAEAFIQNLHNKPYVNHIDGNKINNKVDNLEWVTPLENNLHAYNVLHKHPMRGIKYDKNKNSHKVEQHYISEEGYDYCLATYANAKIASIINNLNYRSILACCKNNKMYQEVGGYIWKRVT